MSIFSKLNTDTESFLHIISEEDIVNCIERNRKNLLYACNGKYYSKYRYSQIIQLYEWTAMYQAKNIVASDWHFSISTIFSAKNKEKSLDFQYLYYFSVTISNPDSYLMWTYITENNINLKDRVYSSLIENKELYDQIIS